MTEPVPTPRCDVSVVVPTHGGEGSLPELCARLARALDGLGTSWEILLIDDASPDATPEVAARLAADEPRIRYRRQPQNGGQHPATVTGLRMATGYTLVTIDDDLQQPPEALPAMLGALRPGVDVAIARFPCAAHPFWRRVGSYMFNRWLGRQIGAPDLAITSFKALRRPAVDALLAAIPDDTPYYLGRVLLAVVPRQRIVNVDVPHHERRQGRTGYNLPGLWRVARGAFTPVPGMPAAVPSKRLRVARSKDSAA